MKDILYVILIFFIAIIIRLLFKLFYMLISVSFAEFIIAIIILYVIPISLWFWSYSYYKTIKKKNVRTPGLFFLFSSLIVIIPLIYLIFNIKMGNYIDDNKINSFEYVTNHFYTLVSGYADSFLEAFFSVLYYALYKFIIIILPIIELLAASIYILVCCSKLFDMKLKETKDCKKYKILKYLSIPMVIIFMLFLCLYNYKDTIKQFDNSPLLKEQLIETNKEEYKDKTYNYLVKKWKNLTFTLNDYYYNESGYDSILNVIFAPSAEYYLYNYYCDELEINFCVYVDNEGNITDDFVESLKGVIANKLNLKLDNIMFNNDENMLWRFDDYNFDLISNEFDSFENILNYISYSDIELIIINKHSESDELVCLNYLTDYNDIIRDFINSYVSIINQKTNSNITSFKTKISCVDSNFDNITININNNTFSYTINSTYYEYSIN